MIEGGKVSGLFGGIDYITDLKVIEKYFTLDFGFKISGDLRPGNRDVFLNSSVRDVKPNQKQT